MNNDSPSQLLVYSSLWLQSDLIVYEAAFNVIEIKHILFLRAPRISLSTRVRGELADHHFPQTHLLKFTPFNFSAGRRR